MNKLWSVFTAMTAFAAASALHATIDRDVEKTFTVTGTGTLHLETYGGAISVVPGADGVVKITAHERIHASSDSEADELLKNLDLTFNQTGRDVSAAAKYTGSRFGFHFGSWPPVNVDFTATVPAAYATDLHTSGGSVTVGDLNGAVNARTSGGPIRLGKLGGPVDARTSGGSINLDSAKDDTTLDTSGGPISVGRLGGPSQLSTSGGSIRIDAVEHSVRAHTSGGSIRAGLVGTPKGDCRFDTSGGSVQIGVDKTAAFELDAATSGGGVSVNGLTITLQSYSKSRDKLVGTVNGGGPLLKLRSSGGSITVSVR